MRRRVAAAPVGRLATIDPDGRPNVVPFVFVLDGDTLFSPVDAKPKRTTRLKRVANIERDPRVTVLVDEYAERWRSLWWVRVRGAGRVVDNEQETDRALGLLRDKYPQYAETDPGEIVLAVDVQDWTAWEHG